MAEKQPEGKERAIPRWRLPEHCGASDFVLWRNASILGVRGHRIQTSSKYRQCGVRTHADSLKPKTLPAPPFSPALKNTGQPKSVIIFWRQHMVSQMDFVWQLKGVNTSLDSEVPPHTTLTIRLQYGYVGSSKLKGFSVGYLTILCLSNTKVMTGRQKSSSPQLNPQLSSHSSAVKAHSERKMQHFYFLCLISWLFIG